MHRRRSRRTSLLEEEEEQDDTGDRRPSAPSTASRSRRRRNDPPPSTVLDTTTAAAATAQRVYQQQQQEKEEEEQYNTTTATIAEEPTSPSTGRRPSPLVPQTIAVPSSPLWGRKPERKKGLEDDDDLDDRQLAFVEDTALLQRRGDEQHISMNPPDEADGDNAEEEEEDEEDAQLKAALLESQRQAEEERKLQEHRPKRQSQQPLSTSSVEEVKENARTLRSLLLSNQQQQQQHDDYSTLEFLDTMLSMCKDDQHKVTQAIEDSMRSHHDDDDDDNMQLEELFDLNSNLLDAIQKGEAHMKGRTTTNNNTNNGGGQQQQQRRHRPSDTNNNNNGSHTASNRESPVGATAVAASYPATSNSNKKKSNTNGNSNKNSNQKSINLDVENLVQKKDIFSLICMLRVHHNDKRLDAAVALMHFARDAEQGDVEFIRIREEIRSSGGMHSFLTLFRTNHNGNNGRLLKVVTSLAVAYVLPSFVESSGSQPSSASLGLKIVECLRFLSSAEPTAHNGEVFTREEMFDATAKALTTFWVSHIEPSIYSKKPKELISDATTNEGLRRHSSWGRQRGRLVDQREESFAATELLEVTVSLIIQVAKEESDDHGSCKYSQTLIEQVCAIESARPIAVRRGILQILVGWIRSGDRERIRPAVSALRYVTSINDKYMAGWIHSEMVNKGAVQGLVELTHDISATPDIRLAIAQILSSLCAAPHTRAAVVEAKCVKFLISMLYEFNDNSSKDVALYAGNAILQLASGALARASFVNNSDVEVSEYISHEERDSMVGEIVESGAISAFVSISRSCRGKLASVAIRALRVISEDVSTVRQTRLQLCEDNAAISFGVAMKHSFDSVSSLLKTMPISISAADETCFRNLHEALCALSNILDPSSTQDIVPTTRNRSVTSSSSIKDAHILLTKGCLDTAQSGGLETLLEIAKLPADMNSISPNLELLDEASRSLAFLSPILLTHKVATAGYTKWSHYVWVALHNILDRLSKCQCYGEMSSDAQYLCLSVLNGLGALAASEPLKVRIIEKTLPLILEALNVETQPDISTTASQTFQSLNLSQDEVSAQVVRNSASICAELFCLQRSFILQDMARTELRRLVETTWKSPIQSAIQGKNDDKSTLKQLFGDVLDDMSSTIARETLISEYNDVYGERYSDDSLASELRESGEDSAVSLLSRQTYPMNSSYTEIRWILEHGHAMLGSEVTTSELSDHVRKLLKVYFPSTLLRDHVVPVDMLRDDSPYNFRAIMMAQRRYFSFRREGQLVVSLVDRESTLRGPRQLHCTLGFTNSEFGGEFSESLVQVLYKCPLIRGLSFVKNQDWRPFENDDNVAERLLASLVGQLPHWISHLTFDGVFIDDDLMRLVRVLESMGGLTTAQQGGGSDISDSGQRFGFLALTNCPSLSTKVWSRFFILFGGKPVDSRAAPKNALAQLKCLDLSGNHLGDELCAYLLNIVLDEAVGCCLEELDLSNNRINGASMVVTTLRDSVSKKKSLSEWKSSLRILRLASNGLVGKTWLEILSLLNGKGLRLKSLDLSSNSLVMKDREFDLANIVVQAVTCHCDLELLNLSRNRFSSPVVDHILRQLTGETSCNAVLLLKENHPPLSVQQSAMLRQASLRGRKCVAKRHLRTREKMKGRISAKGEQILSPSQRDMIPERASLKSFQDNSLSIPDASFDQAENSITVLFSAPLVFTDGRTLRPFAKLDFDLERELMWQCLKEASRDIELSFDSATHERLLATMAKRCSCLHYSGHGHAEYLPFEDGSGGPYWFKVNQFKSLIEKEGGAPFRFVFVSACYSYLAGETFASAGVPHVVCCQQESELKDTAALAFTRQFYLALAIGHTVRVAFDQGCKAVRATPNLRNPDKEMKKFLLLPENGNHDVPIFNARPIAEWPNHLSSADTSSASPRDRKKSIMGARSSELSVRNMMQEDPSPSPPEFFLGREVDMYYTLKAVLGKRLVTVTGEPGFGRSSLVCALCHYINERATTIIGIERIYYIKARKSQKRTPLKSVVQRLLDKLCEQTKRPASSEAKGDLESMFDEICRILKHARVLIVFDRVELIVETHEAHEFPVLLSKLSRETKNVKVLMTNRQELGIPSLGEHPICLGPLNFANTVRLFANLCPYLHTPTDRKKLFEALVTDSEEAELLSTDPGMGFARKEVFRRLGDGIPSKVEKAAYDLTKEDFLSLYKSTSTYDL